MNKYTKACLKILSMVCIILAAVLGTVLVVIVLAGLATTSILVAPILLVFLLFILAMFKIELILPHDIEKEIKHIESRNNPTEHHKPWRS